MKDQQLKAQVSFGLEQARDAKRQRRGQIAHAKPTGRRASTYVQAIEFDGLVKQERLRRQPKHASQSRQAIVRTAKGLELGAALRIAAASL